MVDDLRIGGAQRQVAGLAGALAACGHTVVLACTEDGPAGAELAAAGVSVVVLGRRRVARLVSPMLALRIARLARVGRFDVVHAHVHAATMAAALAGLLARVPVVVTEHSMASWRGPLARAYSRPLYRRCALILAVSEQIADRLRRVDGVPAARVRVVGTAVFGGPPAAPAYRRDAPVTVGVVGRLEPEKGVEFFLRAAARLVDRHPGVAFTVVGDGRLREDLHALARHLRLGDRVRFRGMRTDGPAAVAALDILCVPSLTEGAPLVVLEAMAAGVPVIATTVGAIPHQLGRGHAGVLVEPADVTALTRALDSLLTHPRERRRLGRTGRRHLTGLANANTVTDAVCTAYRDALHHPGGPSDPNRRDGHDG
ncbi:glycosyltransferase family 4 protein [Embleya sp. NPDC008237]|uniref:glycosyltransferase family 4 protein n=1 Tax=Embleya sp. NPDC008237 TaxID=3363978 RepID=UPI0036E5A3A4